MCSAILILWGIELMNTLSGRALSDFGIIPRDLVHSYGILTAPLIHHNLWHLIGNSIPLFFLGLLVHQTRQLFAVTVVVYLGSGILVWLMGRHAVHIGASGVVLGYWGFLLANGWINHSIKNILLSLITLVFYGGLIFSLLDFRSFISFESHIAGFVCGIFAAYLLKNNLSHAQENL